MTLLRIVGREQSILDLDHRRHRLGIERIAHDETVLLEGSPVGLGESRVPYGCSWWIVLILGVHQTGFFACHRQKIAYPADMDGVQEALRHFESESGLHLVVHASRPASRSRWSTRHARPCCALVKNSVHGWRCYEFEVGDLRAAWRDWPDGRVHRCHAGLLEWVVPVVDPANDDHPLAWLFAGQARAADSVATDITQPPSVPTTSCAVIAYRRSMPNAAYLLEQLRHLAARLAVLWSRSGRPNAQPTTTRRRTIDDFLAITTPIRPARSPTSPPAWTSAWAAPRTCSRRRTAAPSSNC